jgi:hypothetical protein
LPQQIIIFAIEVENASSFSEECTPEVMRAVPVCVSMIIQELNGDNAWLVDSSRYFIDSAYPKFTVDESETAG